MVTASALTLPDLRCGAADSAVANSKSTSPPINAVIAGPPPLYVTLTVCSPVAWFSISTARKLVVPAPFEPAVSLSSFLASATSSCTDFAGTVGWTTSNSGTDEIHETGIKSFTGSNAVSYTHLRAHETPEHLVC